MESKQASPQTVHIKPGAANQRGEIYCPLVRAVVFASVCRNCNSSINCRNRH